MTLNRFQTLPVLSLLVAHAAFGAPAKEMDPHPTPAPFTNGGAAALQLIKPAAGIQVALFAEEPMLGNPVCLSFDDQGKLYVGETHRYKTSVWDSRGKPKEVMEADLACRTVEDRLALNFKVHGDKAKNFGIETEAVRLLEDRDHDGKADHSSLFAEGFNSIVDGATGGILAWGDQVYFANVPNFWRLDKPDADGRSTGRTALLDGFGVHYNYTGHDFHGPVMGPDGMLYTSIGDRGVHVKTKEGGLVDMPDEGGIYRCWPDGSGFELVHRGMRNPHDLAFDKYGNLFTGDNDADKGDEERVIHVVDGGDSGWRIGYQWPPMGNDRDPWLNEDIFVNHAYRQSDYYGGTRQPKSAKGKAKQPAKIRDPAIRPAAYLPHVGNCGDGPAGLAYNPGVTGLTAEYDDHFFLTHFRATATNSAIYTWSVKQDGATFRMENARPFIENGTFTDITFAPDGQLYLCDFPDGYARKGKGRVYRAANPQALARPAVKEVQRLLAEGMASRETKELTALLSHGDMRIRQRAQFELAARGPSDAVNQVLQQTKSQLAAIHAIWCVGQWSRNDSSEAGRLLPLLKSADSEIRAQAAKTLGQVRFAGAESSLIAALADSSPRVRFFAANGLGRIGSLKAVPAILKLLAANADQDAYLRHACAMALSGIKNPAEISKSAADPNRSVRLGVLLAMRLRSMPEIASFLKDPDPLLVVEAARAINDAPIDAAMPALAAQVAVDHSNLSAALAPIFWQRVVNANYRLGNAPAASALVRLLQERKADERSLTDAATVLGEWAKPPARDRIIGNFRPLPDRDGSAATAALTGSIGGLLTNSSPVVQAALAKSAAALGLAEAGPPLMRMAGNSALSAGPRVAALQALAAMKVPLPADFTASLGGDKNPEVRRAILATDQGGQSVKALADSLKNGSQADQQNALAALGRIQSPEAAAILIDRMKALVAGRVAEELKLDVLEAARASTDTRLVNLVKDYETSFPKDDPVAPLLVSRFGGNAKTGARLLSDRAELSCLQCHMIQGRGSNIGPDLSAIGSRVDRSYLLESLVAPAARIAKGFALIAVTKTDGGQVAGTIQKETATELVLKDPAGKLLTIPLARIKSRSDPVSGMPAGLLSQLTAFELRDLIEYLASLKAK